jgi:hypothetical protein
VEAYGRSRAKGETTDPLVIAGGAGWMMEDFGQWMASLGLAGSVITLGYVDDDCLQWLYTHCQAFCYPSL